MPDAVFCAMRQRETQRVSQALGDLAKVHMARRQRTSDGLIRWTRMRSSKGTTALIDLTVSDWAESQR